MLLSDNALPLQSNNSEAMKLFKLVCCHFFPRKSDLNMRFPEISKGFFFLQRTNSQGLAVNPVSLMGDIAFTDEDVAPDWFHLLRRVMCVCVQLHIVILR